MGIVITTQTNNALYKGLHALDAAAASGAARGDRADAQSA